MTVIYILLVAHFLADFVAQSDWMATNKSKRWDALALHVAVYTLVIGAAVVLWGVSTLPADTQWWVCFLAVNAAAHFVQDAITSRINARLWFFEPHDGVWAHISVPSVRGTALENERLINPWVAGRVGNRHWFFVAIGFDQLLHYVTLFVTAGWWLR